eukprot:4186511-Amphidinium_carterae.1
MVFWVTRRDKKVTHNSFTACELPLAGDSGSGSSVAIANDGAALRALWNETQDEMYTNKVMIT